jgi:drug/metabolite transporter (DMT)-like permease
MFFTVILLTPLIIKEFTNKDKISMSYKHIAISGLSGIFLALHFSFWITSLEYTSITSSTVLVTLQPLFVLFGAYLLYRESVSILSLIGGIIAICGGVMLGYGDMTFGTIVLRGDLLALLGSIFLASYILVGKYIRIELDLLPYIYTVYLSATIILFLENIILFRQPLTGYSLMTWVWFVAMAVIPNILGQSVFCWALKYVKASIVSVCLLGEPVGATILAFIIWNEIPGVMQITGGLLILLGLAIIILLSKFENMVNVNQSTNQYKS